MILYLILDCTLIFKESVNLVLTDKGFDIPSTQTKNALLCAQQVCLIHRHFQQIY